MSTGSPTCETGVGALCNLPARAYTDTCIPPHLPVNPCKGHPGHLIARYRGTGSGLATFHLLVVELSMQGCPPCVVARDPISQAWGAPEHSFVLGLGRPPPLPQTVHVTIV